MGLRTDRQIDTQLHDTQRRRGMGRKQGTGACTLRHGTQRSSGALCTPKWYAVGQRGLCTL